ncbi:MAG: RecX family transcriptional regulator [Paludibacteraceae bacterium]|nr:RecX family transcriptional regulator [Paludibacteraceae bacterium]
MPNKQYTPDEWLPRATAYCAQAERCAADVRLKLRQWGCADAAQSDSIIRRLYDESFLSDARYCRAFVHDKVAYQGWGRVKIRMMLLMKQLPEKEIDKALEETDDGLYREALRRAVARYGVSDRDRTIRFCLQRGFTYEEILQELSYSS